MAKTAYQRAEEYVIPDRVQVVIDRCNKILGTDIELDVIPIVDYYGYPIAYAQGFTIADCTYSLADGPSHDYNREALEILKPFGFAPEQVRHTSNENPTADRYEFTDVIYKPSIQYKQ